MSISIDPDLHKQFKELVEDTVLQALEAGAELPDEFELTFEGEHYQTYWDTFYVVGHRVRVCHLGIEPVAPTVH